MKKKEINVLVNDKLGSMNASYINFLSLLYTVNTIPASNYNNEKIDLLLFIGGEDVNPNIYNERIGRYTSINKSRDDFEIKYMMQRRAFTNVPKLGICRGAQFLTALSGGKLIQHVNNHAISGEHPIVFKNFAASHVGKITSTHHQMMYPYDLPADQYEIIATTVNYLSTTYLDGNDKNRKLPSTFEECEIVYYNNTKSLCIQGHPESLTCNEDMKHLLLELISSKLQL